MFDVSLHLRIYTSTLTWRRISSFKLKLKKDLDFFKDSETAFKEAKNDKLSLGRLDWTRPCRVMMVCSSKIAKFRLTYYRTQNQKNQHAAAKRIKFFLNEKGQRAQKERDHHSGSDGFS
jgi:hypothetical protein